jgi:hypothetical protein
MAQSKNESSIDWDELCKSFRYWEMNGGASHRVIWRSGNAAFGNWQMANGTRAKTKAASIGMNRVSPLDIGMRRLGKWVIW